MSDVLQPELVSADKLLEAFIKHRTATHILDPAIRHKCKTCAESDEAIANYKAARGL